ncbi:hypothetical protein Q4534_08450 [Cyclobacterium sp. 1_MG-2023]|uniref:hypothetical protein n=1 Tax=Cyclobacterium sp. 1_MG-2023 TaxID=3062681 RepID=UPI0026E22681|nr:hypothetical protein [Cyclobacterium sp. 1_MG-2023]MDO6437432.1 hypothetical protein [Cyclobacterium sp. 1_MG-2023]
MRNIFCSLFIFSLCSLLLVNKSSAQSNGDILLSTGIQFFAGNDEGFSSMNYRGNKSTSTLGFVLTRENKTLYFLGDFSYGVLANTAGATINELGVNYSHFTFYHRKKANDQGLFWGWSNKNSFHIRRHNNFSNYNFRYDYFSALGPAARYVLPFQWKNKTFTWRSMASWQLIGFQIKSGYTGAEPENYQTGNTLLNNFFNTVKPFTPLKDLDLGLSSALYWKLPTNNELGLRYQFNYGKLSGIKNVYRMDHSIDLSLKVRLW